MPQSRSYERISVVRKHGGGRARRPGCPPPCSAKVFLLPRASGHDYTHREEGPSQGKGFAPSLVTSIVGVVRGGVVVQ